MTEARQRTSRGKPNGEDGAVEDQQRRWNVRRKLAVAGGFPSSKRRGKDKIDSGTLGLWDRMLRQRKGRGWSSFYRLGMGEFALRLAASSCQTRTRAQAALQDEDNIDVAAGPLGSERKRRNYSWVVGEK